MNERKTVLPFFLGFLILLAALGYYLISADRSVEPRQEPKVVRITSIEDGAVVPANFLFPSIEWVSGDEVITDVVLTVRSTNHTRSFDVSGVAWRPETPFLEPYFEDGEVCFEVRTDGGADEKCIKASENPLNDYIVYRVVEPLFNPGQDSSVRVIRLDDRDEQLLFKVEGKCIGCHSYSPGMDLFNVKKDSDRRLFLALKKDDQVELEQRNIGHFSFFSTSADGEYAAIIANALGSIALHEDPVRPFDLVYKEGDIFIYSMDDNTLKPLPGASELDYVEDMPCFSPDGEEIVYSRYTVRDGRIADMYLFTIPFKGGNGGEPQLVQGIPDDGMATYFAGYSPDGKWLSFCRGEGGSGIFARESSDIYIMPRNGGAVRRMNLNREGWMDSWHAWSSDSRWLIFSAKRPDDQLTSLYLAYIDEEGKDYLPVKIAGSNEWKVNLPLFLKDAPSRDLGETLPPYIRAAYEN